MDASEQGTGHEFGDNNGFKVHPAGPVHINDVKVVDTRGVRASSISSIRSVASVASNRQEWMTLLSLCFVRFVNSTFGSLMAPFFPIEAAGKGVSSTNIGFIFAIYSAVGFFASPIFGYLMRRVGTIFIYRSGIFVTSSCAILFGVLQWCPGGTVFLALCYLLRCMQSLGGCALMTAGLVIVNTLFKRNVSLVMGAMEGCNALGLMIGPPLGGLLYSAGGFNLPFFFAGGLSYFVGITSVCLMQKMPDEDFNPEGEMSATTGFSKLMKIPTILAIGYLVLFYQATIGFTDVALSPFLSSKLSASPVTIGLLFLIPCGMMVLMSPANGYITGKYQKLMVPMSMIGLSVGIVGLLLLAPAPIFQTIIPEPKMWTVILALFICGFGMSVDVINFPLFTLQARENGFPDDIHHNGLVSGLYTSFTSLGAFLGPSISGVMLDSVGFGWACTVFAGLAGLGVVIVVSAFSAKTCCQSQHPNDDDDSLLEDDGDYQRSVNPSSDSNIIQA